MDVPSDVVAKFVVTAVGPDAEDCVQLMPSGDVNVSMVVPELTPTSEFPMESKRELAESGILVDVVLQP
jgi:hypothetical protein